MEDAAWFGASTPDQRIALVAPTSADARDTMVEGESGLFRILPEGVVKTWNRSLGELVLINGTRYKLFTAEEPNRLRGPQHHRAYCDELAAWEDPDTWDQLLFGLRLGAKPRVVIATTPRPTPLLRRIAADPHTVVSRGSTFENAANLAPSALEQLRLKYEGTRLGRQELNAEILNDVVGGLWEREVFDKHRVKEMPQLQRVVVAVDPSGTDGGENGDSVGIVVAGKGYDGRGYVIADWTCRLSPAGWGRRVADAYRTYQADCVVAERNFGGAMVEHVIRTADPNVSFREVVASRGKAVRAEPIAALYEQGRISHVGRLDDLEDQACRMTREGYVGDGSPDRLDAMVWALSDAMLGLADTLRFEPLRI